MPFRGFKYVGGRLVKTNGKAKGKATSKSSQVAKVEAEFHYFPKPPTELRQKILIYLNPEGRTVTIWSIPSGKSHMVKREQQEFGQAGEDAMKIPTPLLHVDKQLRAYGEKWYTLTFGEQLNGKAIFFDFNRDSLRFSHIDSLHRFCGTYSQPPSSKPSETQIAQWAKVASKVRFLETHNAFGSTDVGLLYHFCNLKLLTSNFPPKPFTQKLLVNMWTQNAKTHGQEFKIPKYRVRGHNEQKWMQG